MEINTTIIKGKITKIEIRDNVQYQNHQVHQGQVINLKTLKNHKIHQSLYLLI